MESPEIIARRKERLELLKKYTNDKNILACVDFVAFDQEDLADLLDEDAKEIYLCENNFVIPLRMKNKNYIGVGKAVAIIRSKEPVDFDKLNITFKNISFDDDYQKIIYTPPQKISQPKSKPSVETFYPPAKIQIYGETGKAIVNYSNRHGISALVQKAKSFNSNIYLGGHGKSVDAKDFLSVINMGPENGMHITITAYGSDAGRAVTEIAKLIGG